MKVNVEIDRLVLHGFGVSDQKIISATIEKELSSLIGEGGLGQNGVENAKPVMLNVGSLTLKTAANPKTVGSEVARVIQKNCNLAVNSVK